MNHHPEGCLINTDCLFSPFLFGRGPTNFFSFLVLFCFSTYVGLCLALFSDYSSGKSVVLFNLLDLSESRL